MTVRVAVFRGKFTEFNAAAFALAIGCVTSAYPQDPRGAATARAFLANFRERRDALRKNYDATTHAELRFDINVESHRLAQWLAPLRTPPPARKADSS